MKDTLVKWILPAVLLIMAWAFVLSALQQETAPTVQPASDQEMSGTLETYFLRLEGSLLTVYRTGEDAPLIQHEILPALLPEEDRRKLEAGLYFSDPSELRQRVEDYLS